MFYYTRQQKQQYRDHEFQQYQLFQQQLKLFQQRQEQPQEQGQGQQQQQRLCHSCNDDNIESK